MEQGAEKNEVCQICGEHKIKEHLVPAAIVRSTVAKEISKFHPEWHVEGFICTTDLNKYRKRYVESLLETEKGELSSLEQDVVIALQRHEILTENLENEFQLKLSFGDRLSDRIATFGGSWKFILSFSAVIFFWIVLNSLLVMFQPFDPYPFIFLNLILSCLAALQAPIIMMSQNRQEAKDRIRSDKDYRTNLKAELEIRHLHEKMDHLLKQQWERLVEIQQMQLETLEELRQENARKRDC
jgi:uncharacterized membrane protein